VSAPTIFLSAGEPSGDMHGAALARALLRRWPEARLFGMGGARMAAAGVELLADLDRLAVMGFAEVVRDLPFFLALLRRVEREIRARQTDLVVPIDYPGFNMRLARRARRAGIPVLYYIAPQVWAWHRSRTRELARSADLLAVILPFEEPLFRAAGARVRFVGHPLLDDDTPPTDRASFCGALGVDPARPLLALFPGSRRQEVGRHLELFAAAAERVRSARPEIQPIIAAPPGLPPEAYAGSGLPRSESARDVLAHATAALVKSGTGTLQAALAGVPFVIAYRTHPLTYLLARRLVRIEHIGLANLVAGERLVPEFVQDAATPDRLAAALLPLLEEGGPERNAMLTGLARIRRSLASGARGGGAAEAVADAAAELLEGR
jgi:lipid-A-disaccharide synthase